jgi:hypothetical protein
MSIVLRQSTASQEVLLGPFLDSTDGDSEEAGLTIANTDILIWKCGGASPAAKNSGGATHTSNGIYLATLDATDTNTCGSMMLYCHMAGALFVKQPCMVLPQNVYDSLVLGTDYLLTDLSTTGLDTTIVEGTITVKQALKVLLGVIAGKSNGGNTPNLVYRDTSDTLDRVKMVADGSKNRTSVTLDLT